jgi:cell wall-associated NlpC family hydrolase
MSVSGLSAQHVKQAVNSVLQAAVLGYRKRGDITYDEGGARWSGIDRDDVAARGQVPRYADCSSFATWCYWNGLVVRLGYHSDIVNGERWQAGYTGTMAEHGERVGELIAGDAVLYGSGWPYEHVALYTGGGLVISNGSEPGPLLLPVHYRPDVGEYRRYI